MITVDTSVAVAAALPWHTAHEVARAALPPDGTRASAPVTVETYSVLTRLPAPHRVAPQVARDYLRSAFVFPPLVLSPEGYERLVDLVSAEGIVGGAVYDAVVAAAALEADATLLTLDRRAVPTYQSLGVDYRLVATGSPGT